MNFIKKHLIVSLQVLFLVVTSVFNFFHVNGVKIGGNAAARVLLAIGPLFGIGTPYKDLYEFVPPFFLMLLGAWVKIFGTGMNTFALLHAIFIFISGFLVLAVCRKIFRNKLVEIVIFFGTIIALHSTTIQTDPFSIDFVAMTFLLGGLTALLYLKNNILKLSVSLALILMASQIKDIYILPVFAVIPYYLVQLLNKKYKGFFKTIFLSALGPLIVIASITAFMLSTGATDGYIQVLKDKSHFATNISAPAFISNLVVMTEVFESSFLWLPKIFATLIILSTVLIAALISQKRINFKVSKKYFLTWLKNYGQTFNGNLFLTIFYLLFILLGLSIYGLFSVDTRFAAIVVCLYIFLGLLIENLILLLGKLKKFKYLLPATVLLLLLAIPNQKVFQLKGPTSTYNGNFDFKVENEIIERTDKNDCILHVYGWGVSTTYIYTQRRPCSKYFLTNSLHQVNRQSMQEEYRNQIFNNPPAAILYTTVNTDFDMERFEREVINLPQILVNCYTADPKFTNYKKYFRPPVTVYWPKDSNKENLKKCITNNAVKEN